MLTEILTIGFAIVANSNHQAGGDCFANRATSDTWKVGNEWYCGVVPDTAEITVNHVVVHPASPVVSLVPVETVSEDNSVSTPAPTQSNPGNDKSVGHAGEKCDKGMCENPDGKTGEHGNSNND